MHIEHINELRLIGNYKLLSLVRVPQQGTGQIMKNKTLNPKPQTLNPKWH